MKEIILLFIGSILTQGVQEVAKDPYFTNEKKEIRQEVREANKVYRKELIEAKRKVRLINRAERLEKRLKRIDSIIAL